MNRLIPVFLVIFVGVFGSGYLLMPGGRRPASPGPAAAVKPANHDDSVAKGEEGTSAAPTSAGDPDEDKARGANSAADPHAKTKQAERYLNKPASPKRIERYAGKPGKPKRIVVKRSPAPPKPAEPNKGSWDRDLERLQGTWRIVDTEYDGNRLAEEAWKYAWEFRGDKYTIKHQGNFTELWTVQLNSGPDPKTIDGTHDITGRKLMGIYEFSDDTLKVCYDLTGNGRPDSFKAANGSRRVCYYFKRP